MMNDNINQLYHNDLEKLKKEIANPDSEKELVKAQLLTLYQVSNKRLRMKVLANISEYFEEFGDYHEADSRKEEGVEARFIELEHHIRNKPENDKTVNYMITQFIDVLDETESTKLRQRILAFVSQLMFNFRKAMGMNYTCGRVGGIVLYRPSIEGLLALPRPEVIFLFGKRNDESNHVI